MHRRSARLLAALLLITAGLAVAVQAQPSDTRLYVPLVRVPEAPSATATLIATATATTLAPVATQTATATVTSVAATFTATPTRNPANCAAEYPTVCIAPPPPDLNCGDIPYRRFTVLPPDRHNFDTDGDGVGCESG